MKKIHIIIIGLVGCLMIGGGLYYFLITKSQAALQEQTKRLEQFAPTGTQENVKRCETDYYQALQNVIDARAKLNKYLDAKMPGLYFNNRLNGMMELWHEQSEVLGPLLMNQIETCGVKDAGSTIAIPAPSANPNDLISDKLTPIVITLTDLKVEGSFRQILAHLRKWNDCKRLVLIDNPRLAGTSPKLLCTYNATVYIFPREPALASSTIAMAGAAGAAGTTPGAAGPMTGPMTAPPPAATPTK